jgi:hypothetical protein
MRFQDLFHSPSGVLFAFPSRYWCTIGRLRVFSLGGWSPHLQTGFHVSRPTCRKLSSTIRVRGYHPLRLPFPEHSTKSIAKTCRLVPFRSPLLWESRLISVPPATEMFQFTGLAPSPLCIQSAVTLAGRVSPFGHLRINARLPAPRSFSQAATSFIACNRQGIHHMHLVT